MRIVILQNIRKKKSLLKKHNLLCVWIPLSLFLCCIFIFMQLDVCLGNVLTEIGPKRFFSRYRVPSISAICPCSSVAVPLPGPGRLGKVRWQFVCHEGSEWEWYIFRRHVHEWLMLYGINADLAGGNSKIFYVHPESWGRFPIWRSYFSKGLKPPTRDCMQIFHRWIPSDIGPV